MTELKRRVEPTLPLFMIVSTVSPHPGGDSPTTTMARRLGLDPSDVSSLQSAVAPPSSARASIGVLGVLLALLTATSFARALQRSYELAWRLPPAGGLSSRLARGGSCSRAVSGRGSCRHAFGANETCNYQGCRRSRSPTSDDASHLGCLHGGH